MKEIPSKDYNMEPTARTIISVLVCPSSIMRILLGVVCCIVPVTKEIRSFWWRASKNLLSRVMHNLLCHSIYVGLKCESTGRWAGISCAICLNRLHGIMLGRAKVRSMKMHTPMLTTLGLHTAIRRSVGESSAKWPSGNALECWWCNVVSLVALLLLVESWLLSQLNQE